MGSKGRYLCPLISKILNVDGGKRKSDFLYDQVFKIWTLKEMKEIYIFHIAKPGVQLSETSRSFACCRGLAYDCLRPQKRGRVFVYFDNQHGRKILDPCLRTDDNDRTAPRTI